MTMCANPDQANVEGFPQPKQQALERKAGLKASRSRHFEPLHTSFGLLPCTLPLTSRKVLPNARTQAQDVLTP
eukprot:634356-Amphidinium_carterae.1